MEVVASEAATSMINPYEVLHRLTSCNAVVVFSSSECCMSTVAKRLLFSLGVGPTVVELDRHATGPAIHALLFQLAAGTHHQPLPAVFVGGKFLGGVQTLMAAHINGTLVPLLKQAGALFIGLRCVYVLNGETDRSIIKSYRRPCRLNKFL
ncbi:Monothiol glutaredoxin-S10 [Glycine soja]